MTAAVLYDDTGRPLEDRTDDAIEGHLAGEGSRYATQGIGPLGSGNSDGKRQVGWTIRIGGKTIDHFAFNINPQSLTRTASSRTQMFATKSSFYVDNFGAGPTTIQLSQLVASGRSIPAAGGTFVQATMRQDVIRFYESIYMRATELGPSPVQVFFHDNHLWDLSGGVSPELVYFPPQAFQLARSVQLHNVWSLQLTMVTLSNPNLTGTGRSDQPIPHRKLKTHIVRRGESLKSIAAKLAGKRATLKHVQAIENQIVALTKKYGKDDVSKTRKVTVYSAIDPTQSVGSITVPRLHITPGEKITIPG